MTQPTFPLICISDNGGLELIHSENSLSKVSTLALIDTAFFDKCVLYDTNNQKWTYRQTAESFRNTWLARVLAKTFYNPMHNAKVIWTPDGIYPFNELKEKIKICVDKDDDIITQFEEGDIIKTEIDNTSRFEEVLQVLNKYVFSVDEEKLWKEQE